MKGFDLPRAWYAMPLFSTLPKIGHCYISANIKERGYNKRDLQLKTPFEYFFQFLDTVNASIHHFMQAPLAATKNILTWLILNVGIFGKRTQKVK